MVLHLWRSLHSLNLMLPKEERRAMLLRLFNDSTPLQHLTRADADKVKNEVKDEGNTSSAGSPDVKENMGDAVNGATHVGEETKVENENGVDETGDEMEEEKPSK
jgi:multisite-specific tRNA:(cytosine-C5)-methyltransferase